MQEPKEISSNYLNELCIYYLPLELENIYFSSRLYESALEDLSVASKLCTTNNDIKKLINKIHEEINGKSNNSTLKRKDKQQSKNYLIESSPL